MSSSALVPMWTLLISKSAELTQWSLYINYYSEGPPCLTGVFLWLQQPLPSSATHFLPSHLSFLLSVQGGLCQLPEEGVGLFQYTVFPARHACVSQCVKVLLWGLVRVFNTVYSLSDFISVPEAASELVIARYTEAVLSKASTHHATVRLSKKTL